MTWTAMAGEPLPGVRGLVFLGFPLHPPGRPGNERAEHLTQVQIPMLFLQGTRDDFADLKLLRPVVKRLGTRATLHLLPSPFTTRDRKSTRLNSNHVRLSYSGLFL